MKITPVYSAKIIIIISVASNLSFFTFNTKNNKYFAYKYNISTSGILRYYFSKKRIILMHGGRHGFINGKQDVKTAEKQSVECIVLLTLWFIILSCLGRCNKRPSHNILLNRSIVHAIRLHVSEVPFSGVVSAHTIVCVCVCTYVYVYTLCMCAMPECRQCSLCASLEQKML